MRNRFWETSLASLQWFMFLLGGTLALPIIIGHTYDLPIEEISGLMQRMFLTVGVSTFLGGWLGHRMPIVDGPAGIWFSVFILMGQIAVLHGPDPMDTLRLLEGGMLFAGFVLVVIGAAGWMNRMLKLFTPLVNGVFLIALTFQLSGVMLKGMFGVNDASAHVEPGNAVIAFSVFILVVALSIWGKGGLKSYAVLIAMILGWAAFALFNRGENDAVKSSAVALPELFAWGWPLFDTGILISSAIVSLVLVSNVIITISAMQQVVNERGDAAEKVDRLKGNLNNSGMITGVSNIFAAVFSVVATVPLSVSAGFVRTTGQRRMLPFFIACLSLIAVSFFPIVYSFLSTLPEPIANAAVLALFSRMVGIGLSSVLKESLDQRRLTILGLSLTLGIGMMFMPQTVFFGLPAVLQYIMSNGVMIAIITSLLLEQLWRPKSEIEKQTNQTVN